jgi:hypothetical protein
MQDERLELTVTPGNIGIALSRNSTLNEHESSPWFLSLTFEVVSLPEGTTASKRASIITGIDQPISIPPEQET